MALLKWILLTSGVPEYRLAFFLGSVSRNGKSSISTGIKSSHTADNAKRPNKKEARRAEGELSQTPRIGVANVCSLRIILIG